MRLPPCIVRKGVEDTERRWTKTYREPGDGCGLRLDHRQTALQEACHLRLLSRFCLQSNKQRYIDHSYLLPSGLTSGPKDSRRALACLPRPVRHFSIAILLPILATVFVSIDLTMHKPRISRMFNWLHRAFVRP